MHRNHRLSPVRLAVAAAAFLAATAAFASAKPEAQTTTPVPPWYGGPGMAGRGGMVGPGVPGQDWGGPGAMGRGGMRGGMRGGGSWSGPGMQGDPWGARGRQVEQAPLLDEPLTLEGAVERVEAAIAERGYQDLVVDEVIQYSWNFYVLVKEKSTGKGAVELLVDPRTGVVDFEPGPNMMWNTKYGHMGWNAAPGTAISADEAKKVASEWLVGNGDSTAWEMDVNEMYGYYTIHLERDGRMEAMLSVNATTRAVWYHSWHGPFVAAKEIG